MKKIFVAGGAGYLGSVLCRKLVEKGYFVRCFDRLYFGDDSVKELSKTGQFELIKGNIVNHRDYSGALDGMDGVAHLAGLANDPTAELDPQLTRITNHRASVELAKAAKERGVSKFVFASSCSVYGKGLSEEITEESPLNPVSLYAESKIDAEKDIMRLRDNDFHPVFLRQATLFGKSSRMRFDLAINLMAVHAITKKKIFVWGGGQQWRPFLHVDDAAEAFIACLEADTEKVSGEVFNVGDSALNYRIIDLARLVSSKINNTELEVVPDTPDKRSYKVFFDKIQERINWRPTIKVDDGISELCEYLSGGAIKDFEDPNFFNIRTIIKFLEKPAREGGDSVRSEFLPFNIPLLGKEEEDEVIDTLRSGWLTTGPRTKKLEEQFKEYLGCRHAICVSSCTAALHLSLVGLGIGEGDEVITTPMTWPATANVIVHTGATPVFADIDPRTMNILPDAIEKKITKRTRAVIPVHMAGQPCRMDEIYEIAKKHKLRVIEDAAHAIGAFYRDRKIGTLADTTCFSFYPIKNMTTIEGGLIATDNEELADKMRIYSLHGVSNDAWARYSSDSKGIHEVVFPGFKYNMSDVQAAVGIHQIKKLDLFIELRKKIAAQYRDAFKQIEEVGLIDIAEDVKSAYHLFVLVLNIDRLKISRDDFRDGLKDENIGTGIHFRSLHVQPYYRDRFKFKPSDFRSAYYLSERIISLPMYPGMTQRDTDDVIKAVSKLINFYKK